MDHQNGGYGYPPYDEDPRAAGQHPDAPRTYRDDPAAYGAGQSQQADPNAGAYDPNGAGYDERGYSVRQAPPAYTDPGKSVCPASDRRKLWV
jgi:hypothetical protein